MSTNINRWSFMSRSVVPLAAIAFVASLLPAGAATLAVVAPTSGPFAALGSQIFAGAEKLAAEKKLTAVRIPESCETGSGDKVAAAIIAAKAAAAVGFLCAESLETGGGSLKSAGIPAISVSVRSKILFEDVAKEGWPIVSLAPRFNDEADKLISVISESWQGAAFAIVDDGTLPARELTEAVRTGVEDKGLKPQFVDTFRPGLDNQIALVRRLQKANATHVLFAGDRSDAAIIARDAAAENIPLTLLGGEALNAADQSVPLAAGVLAVLPPEKPDTAKPVITALAKDGIIAEGYVLPAYAAATIAASAIDAAARNGKPVAATLADGNFETILGPFAFGKDMQHHNPYMLMAWRNGLFTPVDAMR